MTVSHKPSAAIGSLFRGFIAAVVAAIIIVANIVSFSALMFPGDLGAGVPTAIWAMLVGALRRGTTPRGPNPLGGLRVDPLRPRRPR